ncbi:MAG: phospho-2-dehydro-3-deoxyheptonate aldolase [Candidatus Hydrogenedentota bacterium]
MEKTQDINIRSIVPLISPRELKEFLPISEKACMTVVKGRIALQHIIKGEDPRFLVVVGPCSIHDEVAALDYAARLVDLAKRVNDRICLVMRVYFEKPRTTVGWKGLTNDPFLNGTFDIDTGLRKGRSILMKVNEMGMPAATEMLDPITPQYTADLVTWASLGARTTESQTHRQMASGLSMPVGFKNGTDGNLQIAVDAMEAAEHSHAFLGIDSDGQTCVVNTKGNPYGHLILRGGRSGTNYDPASLDESFSLLTKRGLNPRIMVDCSHANSNKDFRQQAVVWQAVIDQRVAGNENILGLMLESNIKEGNQKLGDDPSQLEYGISITDPCIGWEETESLLLNAYDRLEVIHKRTAVTQ